MEESVSISPKEEWENLIKEIIHNYKTTPIKPYNPYEHIIWTPEIEEALNEHLKDFVMIEKEPTVEELKLEEERKYHARQTGQKKFRRNGNNRKRTRGRKK